MKRAESDFMSNNFVVVNPNGTVTVTFNGKIIANELDLTAALGNVTDVNKIRWLRDSDKQEVAWIAANILGTQGGAGADYSGFLTMLASAKGANTAAESRLFASHFNDSFGVEFDCVSAPGNPLGQRHTIIGSLDLDSGLGTAQFILLRGDGSSNAQQVFDGTNATPLITTRLARDFGIVTPAQFATLKGNITVIDGDQVTILVDMGGGIGRFLWRFMYDANSGATSKWQFIGGASVTTAIFTTEGTASNVPVDLATVGPSVTVPLAGDYLITWNNRAVSNTVNAICVTQLFQNAGGLQDIVASGPAANVEASSNFGTRVVTGAAANDVFKLKYYTIGGGTASFLSRFITVTPQRIT